MKSPSGSGTHDVGVIPAMYNSPTAGTQHVPPFSQGGRQASLSNWQQMLVMCDREGLVSWPLAHVCLAISERCNNVNCVI